MCPVHSDPGKTPLPILYNIHIQGGANHVATLYRDSSCRGNLVCEAWRPFATCQERKKQDRNHTGRGGGEGVGVEGVG